MVGCLEGNFCIIECTLLYWRSEFHSSVTLHKYNRQIININFWKKSKKNALVNNESSPHRMTQKEKVIMKRIKGTPVFVLFMAGTKLHNLHKWPIWLFPT